MADALQAVADKVSTIPGNSLGATTLFGIAGDTPQKVGEGADQVGWRAWLSDVANKAYYLVNPAAAIMPSAVQIVEDAGSETKTFVKNQVNKVVGAANGIGETTASFLSGLKDTVKYLAYGLIAVAVIYVLVTFVVPVAGLLRKK